MAAITIGTVTRGGLTLTLAEPSDGDTIDASPSRKAYLVVVTGDTAVTPTALFADDIDTVEPTGRVLDQAPINSVTIYGPFPAFPYKDQAGLVGFNFDTTTNATAGAFYEGDEALETVEA